MKPFLGINLSSDEDNELLNGHEFLVAKPSAILTDALDAVSGKTVPQTSQVILLMDVPPHHGLPAGQATDDPSFSLPVAMPQVPFYRQIISPFFPDYKRDSPNPFWYFFHRRAFLPLPVFSSAQKAAQLRFVHRKVLIFRRFSGMIWGLRRRSICPKNRWPLPFWMGSG